MTFKQGGKTGYPVGLLQDDDSGLSKWFASKPDARYIVRKNIQERKMNNQDALEVNVFAKTPWGKANAAFYEWEFNCTKGKSDLSDDDRRVWVQGYIQALRDAGVTND